MPTGQGGSTPFFPPIWWCPTNKGQDTTSKEQEIMSKTCKSCKESKPLENFESIRRTDKTTYYRGICNQCRYSKRRTYYQNNPEVWERRKLIEKEQRVVSRQDIAQRAKWIVRDSKNTDRKNQMENDLTIEWVKETIKDGCSYCGSVLKLSLDRKNNSLGHMKNNVVSCCWRCNYIRRDMPLEAWLIVAEVAERGMLDGWRAGGRASA